MVWYICLLEVIGGILAVLIVLFLLLIIYVAITTGKYKGNASLRGKTTIITGANTGIGYETALDFAERGAKVYLACRDPKRGQEAVEKISKKTYNKNVFFKQLDLSTFKSVRKFAEEINQSEERLDILVNNAGALGLAYKKTEDGLMLLMQTNYYGPVLLTMLLLDLMKKTANSRIVNVASTLAQYVRNLDVDNLNEPAEGMLKDARMYMRTKLCNILFTIKLAEKLKGTSVTTYSLHPGVVLTEISRNDQGFFSAIMSVKTISRLYLKTPRQGAETTIYCSLAEGIENLSGENFEDCHVVTRYRNARNPDLVDRLWNKTEDILKLT